MTKTMATAANNNTNIEDTIDSREFIANPRKVIAEKLFTAYGFKSVSAATSSALEPIDGDWNLSKVLKKSISESEEEEKKPLLEEEGRVGAAGKGGSDEVNDGGEGDDAGGEGDWTYRDAYVVGFTCCGAGIVVYATALWWHLNRL